VKEGDLIEVDVSKKTVSLLVDEAELARRREVLQPWEPAKERGWLSIYQRLAKPIYEGATLTPK
jgi:dihydroxy-acid dehydratase